VAFRVAIETGLDDVPPDVVWKMRLRLRAVAGVVGALPTDGHFWFLSAGGLFLDLLGWRFLYRIDGERCALVVQEVHALPASARSPTGASL
jgi:hypothetical protein